MSSVTRSIRADEAKWSRWAEAAGEESLNAWTVKRLDEAAELDLAVKDELAERRAERERLKAYIRKQLDAPDPSAA